MEVSCQYIKECSLEVTHECIKDSDSIFLCDFHLLQFISDNGKMQNVKSVNIVIKDQVRGFIRDKLNDSYMKVIKNYQMYQKQIAEYIKSLISQQSTAQSEISKLLSDLQHLMQIVKTTESLKTYKQYPDFYQLFKESPENLFEKFKNLGICSVNFTMSNNIPTLKVKNKCKVLLGLECLKESTCPNSHPLLLSHDSIAYYNFLYDIQKPPNCDFCGNLIHKPCLHCRICNFDVCEDCQDSKNLFAPEDLKCAKGHKMSFLKDIIGMIGSLVCNFCNSEYKTNGWRCENCDFDCCENCARMKGMQPCFEYPFKCYFKHRAVLGIETKEFNCRFCNQINIGVVWKCDSCKVKFCKECVQRIGHKVPICKNGHEMFHKIIKGKKLWEKKVVCKNCENSLNDFGFICVSCDFTYCEKCYMSNH